MTEMTRGIINFPNFRYYKLDRDVVEIDNGELKFIATPKNTRAIHIDILQAVFPFFKGSGDEQQHWRNAMLWSWFNWIPNYFFVTSASSTHKHHPAFANRPDGLLLHSFAVCRIAASLSELFPDMPDWKNNEIIFAAWHHDMFKYGEIEIYKPGDLTTHEHPIHAADFFRLDHVQAILNRPEFNITPAACERIAGLIQSHSGPYRTSKFSDFKLPAPENTDQLLLHKADWFASRKENDLVSHLMAEIPDLGQ